MHKFKVTVNRISYSSRDIEVVASNEEEAKQLALYEAGDYEYSERSAEYDADYIQRLTDEA